MINVADNMKPATLDNRPDALLDMIDVPCPASLAFQDGRIVL